MERSIDIIAMNGNPRDFRYNLKVTEENSKSIYARSPLYGDLYRIEKATGKVFRNEVQIAETSEWMEV